LPVAAIKEIFSKESPDNSFFVQVISSDLDCDRLDYLRRTAHCSGLPYGTVDIDYLIDQARVDDSGYYCFSHKALRAADHLLVSRYYDYLQVPFHKTVVALEWSLVTCIRALIERRMIACSASDIVGKIKDGEWPLFDDNHFFALFHQLRKTLDRDKAADALLGVHLDALLNRKTAKLLHFHESVEDKTLDPSAHASRVRAANRAVDDLAKALGISRDYFHVWDTRLELTKAGSKYQDSDSGGGVHIFHDGKARPLSDSPQALMRTLSKYQFSGVRVFMIDNDALASEAKLILEANLGAVSDAGAAEFDAQGRETPSPIAKP